MSEPVILPNTGTVGFNRKVSVRPYESAEASIFVQFEIPTEGVTPEEQRDQLVANAKAAFFQAKALIYEELGLEFSVEEGGVIREVLRETFGNVTEVTATEAPAPTPITAAPSASGDGVSDTPPFAGDTTDKSERAANKAWAKKRYAAHPDEFYDNRPKKAAGEYNPKAPDVKHKSSGVALWLD